MKASQVILARVILAPGIALCSLAAVPAAADVLEINAGGATWVAGGPANLITASLDAPSAPSAGIVIPDQRAEKEPSTTNVSPTEAQVRGVPAAYAAKIAELAARYDLSPALLEALVWQESRWRAGAVSPKGARGLAQLMPGTARELGVDPDNPFANLEGGARYLREQLDRFEGDLEKALAAYNAGPARVARANGIPQIRETQNYVAAIMGRLNTHSRKDEE